MRKPNETPNVVTEIEERYIFFAKQADLAREQVRLGHSCAFNVYFREPLGRSQNAESLTTSIWTVAATQYRPLY
jgi:hypothetical protein